MCVYIYMCFQRPSAVPWGIFWILLKVDVTFREETPNSLACAQDESLPEFSQGFRDSPEVVGASVPQTLPSTRAGD